VREKEREREREREIERERDRESVSTPKKPYVRCFCLQGSISYAPTRARATSPAMSRDVMCSLSQSRLLRGLVIVACFFTVVIFSIVIQKRLAESSLSLKRVKFGEPANVKRHYGNKHIVHALPLIPGSRSASGWGMIC
jgi:hypothetical protein